MKTFKQFLSESFPIRKGNIKPIPKEKRTSMEEFEKLFQTFLPYVLKELKIKSIPPLHFKNSEDGNSGLSIKNIPGVTVLKDSGFSQKMGTFGQTSQKNRIVVNVENRQPLDALRTIAHELVHYYQHTKGIHGTGETGSPTENEANVRSAIMMRKFDFDHPDVFKLPPIG